MTTNGWKKRAVLAWIAVAVLVVVAVVIALVATSGSTKPAAADGDKDGTGPDPAVVDLLTVTSVTEKCATSTDQNVVKYDIGALKGTPPRKWSDAISTPLHGGLNGVKQAVCTDPLYGVTVANMLANLNVDGVRVASLNPWIRPFADVSKINDKAANFVPLLDVKSPSSTQVQKAIAKNHDYQELANRVNTLLSRFKVTGTDTLRSVKNWHLAGAGLKVGGLPEVNLEKRQDGRKALILVVTSKNACAPLKRIGFNLGDKRPEVFPTPNCKTPGKPGQPDTPDNPPTDNPPPTNPPTNPPPTQPPPTNPPTKCPCVDPTDVQQPVPTPDPGDPNVPHNPPNPQPTQPVDPENPPEPNDGGYNGGSTDQPGQSGNPDPVVPSSDPTNTGDPGGF